MTIEEAIKNREQCLAYLEGCPSSVVDSESMEAVQMSLAALRAQQATTKLDRSRWEGCKVCGERIFVKRRQYMRPALAPLTPEQKLADKLVDLTGIVYVEIKRKFCPTCGRPLTEEAWAELERRLNL